MSTYAFTFTCPQCAGPITYVTAGRPQVITTNAVMRCQPCAKTYVVTVSISGAMPPAPPPEEEPDMDDEPVWNRDAIGAWAVQLVMDATGVRDGRAA